MSIEGLAWVQHVRVYNLLIAVNVRFRRLKSKRISDKTTEQPGIDHRAAETVVAKTSADTTETTGHCA